MNVMPKRERFKQNKKRQKHGTEGKVNRMRLIDADELIKDRVENDPVRIEAMCAPTAYDVEAVSKALKNEMEFPDNHYPEWRAKLLNKFDRRE